jgi:hypothetical protein
LVILSRKNLLKAFGSIAASRLLPPFAARAATADRLRPSDAGWPTPQDWGSLRDAVGGNLFPVTSPLAVLRDDAGSEDAKALAKNLGNPFYIGDQPGLTETLGWTGAWTSAPYSYAVAARDANDIAQAVNFARKHNLRLVVKGAGHSYLGQSNAPDSLLIWTRHMRDLTIHDQFTPEGGEGATPPRRAVTVGAGVVGMDAYTAVTTQAGQYIQGGGCTSVGLAGLVLGGGFGSFSKQYGVAAGSLLEAQVVTADGAIRIANAHSEPDLFWALKGGGGGTFGVVSRMTLALHDLPESFAFVSFQAKANSDDGFRALIGEFLRFYRGALLNAQWGEQARFGPGNVLSISMVGHGLTADDAKRIWGPFLDWMRAPEHGCSLQGGAMIAAIPARHFWDADFYEAYAPSIVSRDDRPEARPGTFWWRATQNEVAWIIKEYQSLWLPEKLLGDADVDKLADALFVGSRAWQIALHCNKGLAGARPEALADAKETAVNPAAFSAFALAISGDAERPAQPGLLGAAATPSGRVDAAMRPLRALVPDNGSYVNESDYFLADWQRSLWGANYPRLLAIKRKYDPDGLFFVRRGVGSEDWTADGFVRAAPGR